MPNTPVRAAAEGTPKINRRGMILAGLTAAVSGFGTSAHAADPDAELFRLNANLHQALKLVAPARKRLDAAERRYRGMRSSAPQVAPERLMNESGLTAAMLDYDDRLDHAADIADSILATRAHSHRGIGIKAALPMTLRVSPDAVLKSIAADVALFA